MPDWRQVARRKALKYGLDPDIFVRQINAESGFNPKARSPAGAAGIAQIMPATAQGWGVNPWKPRQALDAAAKNMAAYVKQYGGYENALRAYNAGPGAIQASRGYAETNAYVSKILNGEDPGGLGQPRRPGRQGSRRGGGGQRPVTLSDVISTNGSVISPPADNGLLASLLEQRQGPQPVPVSAPDPVAFGADRYLRGASANSIAPSAVPQRQESGLAAQLAALGAIAPSITVPGGQRTVSTTGTAPNGRGSVGKTLVIGDSLGVGTAPELRRLGLRVTANVNEGRSSRKGVSILRNLVAGKDYDNIVFDLGTNDASAGQLKSSLREALRLAPNATFIVPTVNGPGAAAKNRVIKQIARNNPNVEIVRWHGATQGGTSLADGIHGDYVRRAKIVAREIGYVPPRRGHTSPGSLPDSIRSMMERANQLDARQLPYAYGGGHNEGIKPSLDIRGTGKIGLDCSATVAKVLGIDARHSSQFMTWGKPGRAKNGRGVTVYANNGHVLMEINGRFFGTSQSNPGGGPGWIPRSYISSSYLSNFTARHL